MKYVSRSLLAVLIAVFLLIIFWHPIRQAANRNLLSILTQRTLLADPASLAFALSALKAEVEQDCALNWQIGIIEGRLGNIHLQQEAWSTLLKCGSNRGLQLVRAGAPENLELARLAVQQHPDEAEGWFWMAENVSQDNPVESARLYSQGLKIDPSNGSIWCRLGQLQDAGGDIAAAEVSFFQCCLHGDPGKNGCYGAGVAAEKQGNLEKAINYYRFSRWEGALQRANELEASLNP